MNKKIILTILLLIILGGGTYYFVSSSNGNDNAGQVEEKQLYTCGMHPDIIQEEPGDCPICGMKLLPVKSSTSASSGEKKERKIIYWRAPMNPNEIYDKPGKSRMGMDLVPVYEDEVGGEGIVTIDPAIQQNMNVRIDEVTEKTIKTEVITNGILRTDERREFIVTTKVGGWVEKMYVNYTGQEVKKGQKLIDIYSPELVAAQQEFLTALDYSKSISYSSHTDVLSSGNELIKNARRKLELFDISAEEIENLKKTGKIKTYMTLYAPFDGTVIHKNIIEGQKIMPGTPLLKIADLKNLWLIADVYEYELSKIKVGSDAEIRFNYLPGKVFHNKVSFIYPTLDAKTRTVKVRIDIKNSNNELKPDMYADVVIKGKTLSGKPVVPEQAIIRSGRKSILILALGNGKFKPVEVKLGEYAEGYYQVLDGISVGNKIATSAQFLIDSESSLRSAVSQFRNSAESKADDSSAVIKREKEKLEQDHSTMDMDETLTKDNETMDMSAEEHNHSEEIKEDDIVRKGVIDVESIDKNKDGKVFQDIMDWNVISDKPGRCPICNMKLKEFTIEEAKQNLIDNGFKVK